MARNGNKSKVTFLHSYQEFRRIRGDATIRPATVTREDLNAWHQLCVNRDSADAQKNHGGCNPELPMNHTSPLTGQVIAFPSWLVNNDDYRVGRGEYSLPWNILDEYNSGSTQKSISQKEYAAALMADASNNDEDNG